MASKRFSIKNNWKELLFFRLIRKKIRLWAILSVLIFLVIIFMYSGNGFKHSIEIHKQTTIIEARNDSLRLVNEWRKKRIDLLDSGDTRTLEEEARMKNMKYDGETIYRIEEVED